MKNKVLKTILTVVMIIALTIADFVLLGTNLLTYALEINVAFDSYFKTEQGAEVNKIDYPIDSSEMKLYMKVTVKNDGYFDGVITLDDSNFRFKQEILSESEGIVNKIEENVITLNRIQNGKTVEVVVGIEPIIEQSYEADMLSKECVLKLTGKYKDSSEKDISIEEEKKVQLTLLAPTDLETALDAEVITNIIYKIGEKDKRIVQIELNSSIVESAYPIKSTTFEVALPEKVESLQVISKGTKATNAQAERTLKENKDYIWDKTNNKLQVKIENTTEDGKISWKQNVADNIIVTLILPEETEVGTEEYSAKSKVEFYGEDKKVIEQEIKYNLEKEVYEVIVESNGAKVIAELEEHCPSLVLLDWMLPKMSGVEICKLIRTKPDIKNIPIIMLTAKGQEEDKIKGLTAGADDYVTKPFSVPELMARIKTNLRRAPEVITIKELVFEDIKMDLTEKKVFRSSNYIHLGPTEFRLLKLLMSEPKKVFSREVLLKTVWGDNIYVESRTVDVHIRRLRRALNEFGPDYIRTVRATGYSIDNSDEAEEN